MNQPTNDSELQALAKKHSEDLVRDFEDEEELDLLISRIRAYLRRWRISTVVLGVSGGIDSAVALAVLTEVQKYSSITIRAEVISYSIYDTIFDHRFVEALRVRYPNAIWHHSDLSATAESMMQALGGKRMVAAEANITYALRYSALFARAQQWGGITVGTTNKDELEYAGWFGKNSDMCVDVQFLWNYPKCLIRKIARMLGVPDLVIDREPVGDLLDHSTDEENFGCTYDELRWYIDVVMKGVLVGNAFLDKKFSKLHHLAESNYHKYQGKALTHYNPIFI